MANFVSVFFCVLLCMGLFWSPGNCQFRFAKEAAQGARDMWRAYKDMRQANWIGADKYFHARGNYDAARRGPGGKWIAGVISNTRERFQGANKPDSRADQIANRWGRNGGDPNRYRPKGLPSKY
ncbi:serum amyloid A-5 protein-like [Uloborus diversus]|uniref:serum amyloid A-5 protein-like n=1 Tax=Uloborus diversus TaxID=327109 RepID=UPI00240A7319|nr:serum amyloid A-5 protein-like [Uloborus diversus]XP_054710770.1 serum amyloid A-5 protein-like [Uloborus diversus]